jgi:3-hydroxyisobutyrate dehydrogenase
VAARSRRGAAEAISLARALGVDPNDILDALSGGPLDTPLSPAQGQSDDRAELRTELQGLARPEGREPCARAAERTELELPLVEAVHEAFEQAVELGRGDEDLSSVVEVVGRRAAAS